jgi:hypothetical protein
MTFVLKLNQWKMSAIIKIKSDYFGNYENDKQLYEKVKE